MKILVLMPCDEQHVYAAAGIYKALPSEMKECCFPMPMFMDYLIQNKIVGNWIFAFFDAFASMKSVYKTAIANGDNILVIGTAPKDFEFDAVFSFQDIEETMDYQDLFLDKIIKPSVKEDDLLNQMVSNLYELSDVEFALRDCIASADFLTAYMETEIKNKLAAIRAQYEEKLKKGVNLDVFSDLK